MNEQENEQDLIGRLNLIESMIAEGRRATENWGWTFVLWGIVYYVAFGWSAWDHSAWAWPVTTATAVIITAVIASRKTGKYPVTTLSRAVGSVWIALGVSMFLLLFALGATGRLSDQHVFFAIVAGMLAIANAASGLMLRWRLQIACAVVWWVTSVATCFGTDAQSTIVFLVAVFLGLIGFGLYNMIAEAQKRHRHGEVNA